MREFRNLVGLVMGSDSDWPVMEQAALALDELGVPYKADVVSAHRMPEEMIAYGKDAAGRGLRVLVAGPRGGAPAGDARLGHAAPGHRGCRSPCRTSTAWTPCCRSSKCRRRPGGDGVDLGSA